MERIILKKDDIDFLKFRYPDLLYDKINNSVSGSLHFCRSYKGKKICSKYSIEFKLEHNDNSILPEVRETKGRILNIAKRKKLTFSDVHLNSLDGVMCLILTIKEKEFYPNGFDFKSFMNHLEEHFYWITYFDRYNKKPWEDEPHNRIEAFEKAAKENKLYRTDLKAALEKKEKRKLSRPEFRRYMKTKNIL